MRNYLHSKQMADMMKAGKIGPNEIENYIMNDGLPYPGVFSFPDEIILPIELADWYPSEDDIRRLIDGKPIALHIVGNRHPWVNLEVPE